jgi:hypothetical protein
MPVYGPLSRMSLRRHLHRLNVMLVGGMLGEIHIVVVRCFRFVFDCCNSRPIPHFGQSRAALWQQHITLGLTMCWLRSQTVSWLRSHFGPS